MARKQERRTVRLGGKQKPMDADQGTAAQEGPFVSAKVPQEERDPS